MIHVHSLSGLSKSLIFAFRQSRLPTVYDVADYWLAEDLRTDPWLRWWNRPGGPFLQKFWRTCLELAGKRSQLDSQAPTRMVKGYDRIPEVYGNGQRKVTPNSIPAFRFDRLYFCSQALKEATEQAGFRLAHRIGHGIGLGTSFEWPDLAGDEEPLELGTTICIEPAIAAEGAGVMKLEDDLVVTEDGYELLTHSDRSL